MASNNIILAVPAAESSVSYDLPKNASAELSFTAGDIDGVKLDGQGGLVISFENGGQMTLTNFQSFVNDGNTLSLADGTKVDPQLMFNALASANDNPVPPADAIKIGIPAENSQRDITLEAGKKYFFNFDTAQTTGTELRDGKMIVSFENGSKIVVTNYSAAMAAATPPELSVASKDCIVDGDQLITDIQNLANASAAEQVVVVEEKDLTQTKQAAETAQAATAEAEAAAKQEAAMEAQAKKANEIQTAAGDEPTAEELAGIETAAGGAAGGRANSGYGYNSRPALDPFVLNPDIGPIDPTALRYRAPILEPGAILLIEDQDDNPEMTAGILNLDETNLAGGPISVNGTLNIDYGADGFGSLAPNGQFSSGGSQTGGALSSNGVPISVALSADGTTYVGTANGVKVFDLVVNPANGQYTFTQYEQLDHANGSDPNDVITLNFGVTATDGDGDAVSVNIEVNIADDAPSASGATETIDETNLGPIVEQGSITVSFGQDGPGNVQATGEFTATGSVKGGILSSSGVPVDVTATPTGYTGTANGVTVFTLTLNPATGAYTYTQFKNLDHADNSNPDDIITLTFGTKVTDFDGDTANAPIVINIKDDAPIFQPPGDPENPPGNPDVPGNPRPDKGLETVDETNLGPVVETGKLDADFGADVPGSYAFKAGSFDASGSLKNGALTHDGVPVVVTLTNGVYTGKAGDKTIFTLELNTTTGDYKFTLLDNFDHADATNPDDVITLDFGVVASDYEGDSALGSIRINVKDDAPIANDDVNTYDTTFGVANGNVITGLNGGPGAADDLSTDGSNKVIKIAYGDNEVDVPATGTVSINGAYGTLTIASDGTYTYKAFDTNPSQPVEKQFQNGPALPDFDESEALSGVEQQSLGVAPGNLTIGGGETVSVKFVSEGAAYNNTMGVFTIGADGKLKAETVLVANGNAATPGQTFSYNAADNASALGFFLVANGASQNGNYSGIDFSKGSLDFVYNYGQAGAREATISDNGANVKLVYTSETGVKTVIDGPLYFTSDRGGSDNLNADGSVRVVSGIPGDDNSVLRIGFEDLPGLGDKDFNDIVFDVSITKPGDGNNPNIKDQFTYTLQDGDGDTDKALLTLNGADLTDDKPILTAPDVKTVDETNLTNGALTQTGNILVNYGHDTPGAITANGSFTSTGSKLNGALTHMGVPVVVSIVGDSYVGKAGNTTVFTLQVKADGSYTFKQFDNLDHADGSNPDDEISLNFGVTARDADGDTAQTTVVIKVKDDAPVAHNDTNTYDTNGGTATGNVITGLNGGDGAADKLSTDAANTVSKVSFGNKVVDVPATGTATIDGQYGKLTISADGTYKYETFEKGGNIGQPVEKTFTAGPALPDFDESEALDGVEQQSLGIAPGNLSVDAGDKVSVKFVSEGAVFNNTFGVYTVDANGKLKFEQVLISNANNATPGQSFNYTAASNGKEVGFFIIAEGAAYNPGVDLSKGTIEFVTNYGRPDQREATITDDNKVAIHTSENGTVTLLQGPTYFTTNRGDDSHNFDGTVRVVSGIPDGDNTTLRIAFEDLPQLGDKDFNDIVFDVSITDRDCGCNQGGVKDVFGYTLKDGDGDTSNATLTLNGKDMIDSNPIFSTPGVEYVDETSLKAGAVVETGKLAVNFGADAPGTIEGNGTFSSSGSKLNNALTSNGVAVQVTQVGNFYYGKAGSTTVFALEIKADGSYTFKLFDNLDHADASNPNDEIALNFGVDAIDCDGDKSHTTLTVKVKDDAPIANPDTASASEGQTITGNVTANDTKSQDGATIVTKVVFGNTSHDIPATGTKVIVGQYGTLTIDKNGAYSYTARSDNPNGVDKFTYTLKDGDGDTSSSTLTVDVTCIDDKPTITSAVETIDETSLAGGAITETGSVTAAYGQDGSAGVAANGSFTSGGSRLNNKLTSNGNEVIVKQDGNTYTGTAGGATVFTLVVAANGSYTFKLFDQLDHADGNNPNDVIDLNFGVKATDLDGDVANGTITVKVKDDAPIARDDHNTSETSPATGNVITGQNGGPGAADTLSQDVANKIVKVSFGGTTVDVPATGTATIMGTNGTLKIAADGSYTYTADKGASSTGAEKTFVGGPALPDFDESEALDGVEQQSLGVAKGNLSVGEGDVVTVKYVSEGAAYDNTLGIFTIDANGKLTAEKVLIGNGNTASQGQTFSYTAAAGAKATGFFLIADGAKANPNIDFSKGSLDFVYKYGTGSAREATINDNGADVKLVYTAQNGTKTVLNGPVYFTSDRGDVQHLNSDGNVRVVSGLPDQHDNTVLRIGFEDLPHLGDKDFNDIVFDVSIANPDCGCDNSDVFTYTLKDGDGDTSKATLTLDCVATPPVVHINADDACVKEDGNVSVPVTASFTNGSGNETMTLTLTGVASGWKVTGWTDKGNGTYTLTLPQGQNSYNGSLNFKPPVNSDLDLNGLTFKASVYDPDTKGTTVASDSANIIVDAVIDPFKFNGSLTPTPDAAGKIFVLTGQDTVQNSKLNLTGLTYPDADGSESLKKIVFTLDKAMAPTTFISMKNDNGTFTKIGEKGMSGKDTTYTIDLSGMTYAQAKAFIQNKLYLTNDGPSKLDGSYNLGVQIVSYEKNLGGIEKDYSDNQTSYQICLPVLFCISPLVIDLNKNGVELLSQQQGVLFDITNDGIKDKTGWVGPQDGLLALDKNHDGKIGDRSELFGNDDKSANGFDNLAQYDLNKDGVIDTNDAIFKDLKVWQDLNSDGVSQAGELKSLANVNIASIKLAASEVSYDIAGNPVTHESEVTFKDGTKADVVDAWFSYQDGALADASGLTLHGTDGMDVLTGTTGGDTLYGGEGADTFLFQTISEAVDTIKDFNAAEGDKIDLSGVLSHYDPVTDAINDFVFATNDNHGNTVISINETGVGGAAAAHAVVVVENANVNVSDLFNNGSLVA